MQEGLETGSDNRSTGSRGERIAAAFLEDAGYTILERNFKHHRGEIDVIVGNDSFLVFVEVKTRYRGGYGMPEERVTRRKQLQIGRVAQAYLQRHPPPPLIDCRFDVVAVDLDGPEPVIRHLKNAFWL